MTSDFDTTSHQKFDTFACLMLNLDSISIIVPSYNGAKYIHALFESVLAQKVEAFEFILIDDGSTDDTATVVKNMTDVRFKYIWQKNAGVSSARNHGLSLAKGAYVIFFDVDDVMPLGFLEARLQFLKTNPDVDIVSGPIKKFSDQAIFPTVYRGAGVNGLAEILEYDNAVITCPSNYLFRFIFLKKYHIVFNIHLSSTADRYFLIACLHKGNAFYASTLPPLYYRVHPNSMSANLTPHLVEDNARFYRELRLNNLIPQNIKRKSLFLGMFILAAANYKQKQMVKALGYSFYALYYNPFLFFKRLLKK